MSSQASDRAFSPIDFADLRLSAPSRTVRFEGGQYGAGSSWFLVDNAPGQSTDTHRHPYTETWLVLAGEVATLVAGRAQTLHAEQTIVVPALAWHSFTATGADRLRMVCIHASDRIIQEFLADVGADAIPFAGDPQGGA